VCVNNLLISITTNMRLITHNMLQCHVKNCNDNNFPLRLEEVEVELVEADFQADFLRNILGKLEWEAFVNTAVQVKSYAPSSSVLS
jgi:multifunctional methyltransferase subunit TRM112